jgi:glycosyltransferase involved in cell wall biosynthesis
VAARLGGSDGTMRILHVGIGNLGAGGVATYVRSVVSGQRDRGHEVLLSELWPGPSSLAEVQEKVQDMPGLLGLRERWKPDVVHLHSQLFDYTGMGPGTVLTAHEHSSHCPSGGRYLEARGRVCERDFGFLPCLWGHYVDRCGSRDPGTFRRRFRITAAAGDYHGIWIAPSRYSRDRLLDRGMAADSVELVPNPGPKAGDSGEHGPVESENVILFLGRLVPNKGCDVLLRALVRLPRARLRILGEGPERQRLEELSRKLGVHARTEFLGWKSPEEVLVHLARARLLAVPSMWPEPFGLVALEAYAAGRPVVASSIGGLVDIVRDGATGRLVPPGHVPAWANAMGELLADPGLADEMGREGGRLVREEYRLDRHLESLERVYRKSRSAQA